MTRSRPLDPDALAALEEERDFLLRSIEDLDREHAAGDVDDDDHRILRDDYTARAAAVLRSIEGRQAAMAAAKPAPNPLRALGTAVAVLAVAGLAGWGVARAAGDRSEGELITGGIAQSVGQQLTGCVQIFQTAESPVDVLRCYDDILEEHPANVEALTYRSWYLVSQVGAAEIVEPAWNGFEEAVAIDPEYRDVRVFRAVLLNRLCRPDEALAELDVLAELPPNPDIEALVAQSQVRESAEGLIAVRDEVTDLGPPPPIDRADPASMDQCGVLADAGVFDEPAADAAPSTSAPE